MMALGRSVPDNGEVVYLDRIAGLHRELGIPADYALARRMALQHEETHLLETDRSPSGEGRLLAPHAAAAWRELKTSAQAAGHVLQLISAFRSVDQQRGIIVRKRGRGLSWDEIFRMSAAPGYSEHHTGRAVDVNTPGCPALEAAFAAAPAYEWMTLHAPRRGWRMSYPAGNPHGIAPEPWHWFFAP